MKRNFATIDSGETKTIHEFIERHLEPNEREKKLFGEVFTPLPLVQEMLGSIEKYADKDFWKNPNLKILDPAAGIGNFPLIAYEKLMEGMKGVRGFKGEGEKEVEARRRHILEKMLYMVELNPNNVRLMNKIFNGKKYKLNVLCTDFLLETEADIKKHDGLSSRQKADGKRLLEWKTMKFDLVMGNPPFQDWTGSSNGTLWDKFAKSSLNMLSSYGFMAFLNPSGWRNVDGKFKYLQNDIFSRHLIYLEIHNEKDGIKMFESETRYDWYLLKNTPNNGVKSLVKFQDGSTINIKASNNLFIPNGQFKLLQTLLAKPNEKQTQVIHDYSMYDPRKDHMSKEKTQKYTFPCVYTVNSNDKLSLYYSSTNKGHIGIPKFIWSNGRISSIGSYVDLKGEYGLTQFAYAIVDKNVNNLQKIKIAFDSQMFRDFMESCAVGQLTINHKVVSLFKHDFWKHFL
jgi:N-6 DNA Methylase